MMEETYDENQLLQFYDEFLAECYGLTKVAGRYYDTARLLRSVDMDTYVEGFENWKNDEGYVESEWHGNYTLTIQD